MLAEVTITGAMIFEAVKLIALPAFLALAGWLYKVHMSLHDAQRDIKDGRKDIDHLKEDGARQDSELKSIAAVQQTIMLTLTKIETKLEAIQKSVDKE